MANQLPVSSPSAKHLSEGRIGRLVAGAETVEIKATIETKSLKSALKQLGLQHTAAEQRIIYFFDTPKLSLFRSGVIVRARRVPGGAHDSTIKIRPVEPRDVAAKWQHNKGFKLEADAGEKGVVLSASLSRPVNKGVIKHVSSDTFDLGAVFDQDQELFLAEMCRIRYQLAKLDVLGPITALWWKVQHPGLPFPMTAELWTRADKQTLLEVSIRVPTHQAAFANAGLMGFLVELGAKRDNARQTKTLWALEYSATQIKTKTKPKRSSLKSKSAVKSLPKRQQTAVKTPTPTSTRALKRTDKKAKQPAGTPTCDGPATATATAS